MNSKMFNCAEQQRTMRNKNDFIVVKNLNFHAEIWNKFLSKSALQILSNFLPILVLMVSVI